MAWHAGQSGAVECNEHAHAVYADSGRWLRTPGRLGASAIFWSRCKTGHAWSNGLDSFEIWVKQDHIKRRQVPPAHVGVGLDARYMKRAEGYIWPSVMCKSITVILFVLNLDQFSHRLPNLGSSDQGATLAPGLE
eukprot:1462773-Amphidinium_carterae.1